MTSQQPTPGATAGTAARGAGRRWKRRLVRAGLGVVGLCVSVTLIASVFFRIQLRPSLQFIPRFEVGEWVSDLPAHLPWLAVFVVLTALIIPLRALQWRFTLGDNAPPFKARYHAVAIGAFFHNAIPGKLGDIIRSWYLARRAKLPFFHSLASVLVGKLLEFAALIVVVAVSLMIPTGSEATGEDSTARLGAAIPVAAGIFAGLLLAVLALGRYSPRWAAALERKNQMPKLRLVLLNLADGMHAMRSPKKAAQAFLASILPVLAPAIAYGVALQALGVPRGLLAGGVVLGAIALGQLAIGLPIGIGMYYALSSWAARALGADPSQAAALALLTHVATFGTQLLVGLCSLLVQKQSLRDLLRRRKAIEAEFKQAE
ncbi:MAG: lysylphosphatidylglycerol synthase transmembrane domain-containing protein, partial [Myxococcales bacterium]